MRKYLVTYIEAGIYTQMVTSYGFNLSDCANRFEDRFKLCKVIDVKSHPVTDGFWKKMFIWWFC